ncbi:MAG: uroporphyrinogen-III C-methyltransferase [Candidatus Zixiibacteriota bacterium]|nr:MAG: uroporphyrinogen-III C-methyltransferase [candidate division Zixibacteria bacterium]
MSESKTGTVYLVGAGPGDPGLITTKGKELLGSCQAVIYDNLVADELVISLPSEVERHYVGKRSGKPCASQEEINALMVRLARAGKQVVRLKGSDPLIFGRGGEEAKHLKTSGIKFEIVPGVTAGIAAPAYAGIPCTDRYKASFVVFVTGHRAREKSFSTVPWDWLAKAKGGTVVIYMGVGEIEKIIRRLIDNGMSPETPAAVVERGTYPSQRLVTSTLADLPDDVRAHNIRPPSIVIIGDVVDLHPMMEWLGDKPLFGKRIMVTRPGDQAQELYFLLRERGAEVQPYPTISTEEYIDSEAWKKIAKLREKRRWLLFTSENGVRYFLRQFFDLIGDARNLAAFNIAAMGYGSSQALSRHHLSADFVPGATTSVGLAEELSARSDIRASTVVRVCGNLESDYVAETLASAGASVIPLQVFTTIYPAWPQDFKDKLTSYPPDAIIFTSGRSVEGLFKNLTNDEAKRILANAKLVSIGPATTRYIETHGLKVALEAKTPAIPALVEELARFMQDVS